MYQANYGVVQGWNYGRNAVRKYSEILLSVIGLSWSFVDDDVYPTFIGPDHMGLLDFVRSSDPFKVKVGERTLTEDEVSLSRETEDRVISLSPKVIRLVERTITNELQSAARKRKIKVTFNADLPSPMKKVRDSSSAAPLERNPTTLGKTPATLEKLGIQNGQIDQGLGSTSGIRACALRNFDLEIHDYALWEVIENGNSWVPIPVTTPPESGTSTTTKMTVPATIEEKTCKKNDVKARSLLLMALPNEHRLTFDQYVDAQSLFAAIKAQFGGNEATKKTQKALLQKFVSRLAILGVVTPPEDLNVKFLRSLPYEWDTHVVVWMNKPDFNTIGLDDLFNNFKIVEQKVKKSASASNDDKNLAFVSQNTAPINISTARETHSTAGRVVYGRRSKEARKDKGKAIMTEPEPEKKSKKLLEQERLGLEEAIRLQKQVDEEEKAQIARDEEIARQLLALDEERVTTETKTTKDIDWNDLSVQKYWDLKNKPKSETQARKNMIVYLKNESNYKIKDFEGMSYDDIRPIFEKKKSAEFQEIEEEQIEKDISKKTTGKRKKYLPKRRTRSTAKKQKVEQDDKKEELKSYLDIVPREDVAVDVEYLSTNLSQFGIENYTLSENFIQDIVEFYTGWSKKVNVPQNHKDKIYVMGDLHTLFEPDKESEIWMNQNEYNLIKKKYPLSQEMISKMLSKRLEMIKKATAYERLLKFINHKVKK
ncbi:hypothetical protein Tco_1327412 [Tanacetum coccineum]